MKIWIDPDIANKYGLESAFIVGSFRASIAAKKKKPEHYKAHFHDGFYWAYASAKKLSEEYPCLGCPRSIKTKLKRLVDDGVLITGIFNKKAYDKTLWYRLAEIEAEQEAQENSHDQVEKFAPDSGKICPTQVKNLPHTLENSAPGFGKICPTNTNTSSSYSSHITSHRSSSDLEDDFEESVQEPKRISVPRNQRDFEEPLHPEAEPKELTPIQKMVAELVALGVEQITADALVINHKDAVRSQLDWLPHRNAQIPAKYIVKAIRENYAAPKALLEQQAETGRKEAAVAQADKQAKELKERDQKAKAEREDPEAQARARAAIEEIKRMKRGVA